MGSNGPPERVWVEFYTGLPTDAAYTRDEQVHETDEPYHHQRTVDKLVAGLLDAEEAAQAGQDEYGDVLYPLDVYREALELAKQLKETNDEPS